jgi:hypothetical protein
LCAESPHDKIGVRAVTLSRLGIRQVLSAVRSGAVQAPQVEMAVPLTGGRLPLDAAGASRWVQEIAGLSSGNVEAFAGTVPRRWKSFRRGAGVYRGSSGKFRTLWTR